MRGRGVGVMTTSDERLHGVTAAAGRDQNVEAIVAHVVMV